MEFELLDPGITLRLMGQGFFGVNIHVPLGGEERGALGVDTGKMRFFFQQTPLFVPRICLCALFLSNERRPRGARTLSCVELVCGCVDGFSK